jgi:hypothetical protein
LGSLAKYSEPVIAETSAANRSYEGGSRQNPQDIFINYLQHNASTNLVTSYVNPTAFAIQNQKPFITFETNTASCSGFPGISNSFGAALWALDWREDVDNHVLITCLRGYFISFIPFLS